MRLCGTGRAYKEFALSGELNPFLIVRPHPDDLVRGFLLERKEV
jgi:hypothetical protein